jgi:hypothetical protein
MVDYDRVKNKLIRGLSVGTGVFVSKYTGDILEEQLNLQGISVSAGQMALGAGIAIGAEEIGNVSGISAGRGEGLAETVIEFGGYGVHGAGFAEAAENLQGGTQSAQTGASADQVVRVRARGDDAEMNSSSNEDYSLNVA